MTVVAEDVDPPGLERRSPTEAADIDEITRGMLAIQAQAAARAKRPLARGTHAKGICVEAEFEVLDLRTLSRDPAEVERLARGIFAAPGVYPAIVRFANADGGHRRDRWPDVRAMSFSIDVPPGVVPGVTRLDFSMNSASTFPLNDSHAFAVAVRVLSAEGMRAKWKALRSLTWSEFRGLVRVIRLGRKQRKATPRKPFQQLRYWSTVPFLHGNRDAIKYSATPEDNPARPLQAGPNRLQDELVRHVNEDAQMSEFAFALQLLEPGRMTHRGRTQEASFWVENAAVDWNERESPFHVVARLRLRPKSVLSPARAETFAIDVTEHSTPESRPIGSLNRARGHSESASRAARLAQPVVASAWTPDRPGRRFAWTALGVAALLFVAALVWAIRPVTRDLPRADQLTYPGPSAGSNGLTDVERQQYYHLSEGGEAFPIAWLLALEQEIAWPDGSVTYRPFLENVQRFGFLPDPPSSYNPYGLPVGVTAGYGKITGQQMMGLNCTACHVGELHYNGRAFRIDGGPSMAYINAFVKAIVDETVATAGSRTRRAALPGSLAARAARPAARLSRRPAGKRRPGAGRHRRDTRRRGAGSFQARPLRPADGDIEPFAPDGQAARLQRHQARRPGAAAQHRGGLRQERRLRRRPQRAVRRLQGRQLHPGHQRAAGGRAGQFPAPVGNGAHILVPVGREYELGDRAQHRPGARRRRNDGAGQGIQQYRFASTTCTRWRGSSTSCRARCGRPNCSGRSIAPAPSEARRSSIGRARSATRLTPSRGR